ncbi:MAG: RcnB family protein [Gammaproteobacteria bacterium]
MKSKAIVFAAAILSLGATSSAFAQQYGADRYDHNDHRDRYEQRDQRYDRHDERRDERYSRRYEDHRADYRDEHRYAPVYSHRGAGPRYDLYQGNRLPRTYYSDRYVVRDWQRYRLSAPPRGTQWVRAGNDYVLVALATGIIAQVLLNN